MIVIHGAIAESGIYLWGEKPLEEKPVPRKRPGRKPKTPAAAPHPYDAGFEALKTALSESGLLPGRTKTEPLDMFIWMPSASAMPLASSPLIAPSVDAGQKLDISPWTITGISLGASQSLGFLCGCVGKTILAPGAIVSEDLAFLTKAMRFSAALVAKQQFLPGVEKRERAWFARWQPVYPASEADRLRKLAGAMPAACRALSLKPGPAPETASITQLSSLIAAMVDQLVRVSPTAQPIELPSAKVKKKTRVFDSVHDQWLYALGALDGKMEGSEADLARFALQVEEWRRPATRALASAFRLCFRLDEPVPAETPTGKRSKSTRQTSEDWAVNYLLQASDDPSLLVPAELAWTAKGRKSSVLARENFNAREYLLSALGQASGICPNIEASLKGAAPQGYRLDAGGAYEFLTQRAWALEQAGFGVLLPAWWTRKGTKLKPAARTVVKSPALRVSSGLSLDAIVQFNWEIALGGEPLTLKELQELARLKSPLVRVRGQWVELNPEEIQAAVDFWKKQPKEELRAREVVKMALGVQSAPGALPFEGVKATGWLSKVLARLEGRTPLEELPVPRSFEGTLRPYQARGYSWLGFLRGLGLGACLADDMGLGKTVQTLSLLQRDRESNGKKPVLLISPMSVVNNWQKEAARFTPELSVMIHHGAARSRGKTFKSRALKHSLVISSYSLLHRDFEILKNVPWAGVVLDEAQNIKNPETRQARAACALEADYRIALTGTPVENNVGDLWSIMEFLNPGFLGSRGEFRRSFFIPIQANRDKEATERLKRITGPFVLRRLKTDKAIIADLPDKLEMKVFCTLTKEQASLYEAVVKEVSEQLEDSEGIKRKGIVLATLSKLKQVCNHPAQFLGDNSAIPNRSGKLARLTEMMEEILGIGDRALIFTQFTEMGGILRRHLQETFGREVLFLHGAVSKKQRDIMVERFQAEKNAPAIFILSLKAGGTGLNLTRANHVFHFDRWWNPAVENQATDRAFRIGQMKNVQVHKFLCAGTLEERIDEMIEKKRQISEDVVGTGEAWLTELSNTELKKLFALGKNAAAE
ncbi:MAG: DEAD/DEAH box helicase [Syntrophobacteraceae bacterium]|nr:DEAD/DEAH box helicase [Syntrophobacteraceae bacterium]